MPKKHSRKVQYHKDNKKRRMRRMMQDRLRRLSASQLTFRNGHPHPAQQHPQQPLSPDSSDSPRKLLRRRDPSNFIQSLQRPVETNCVFTLYGMITIDENALKNEAKDQSLIKALFNFYSLSEVHINPEYLLLKIHKSKENYFPISYVVERFKSYGDAYFYDMATKIDDIRTVFEKMAALPAPPLFSDKQIDKFIEAVRGKRAMLRISPNCLVFTSQLLALGDYSAADVASECLSYRSFVSDVFLADDYRGQVDKFFELYELGKQLRRGEVSQQQYAELAKQREVEYIVTRDNTVVKVLTSKYNLTPGVGCWEVEQLLGQQAVRARPTRDTDARKRRYLEDSISQKLSTLLHLTKVPENLQQLQQSRVCSYRPIPFCD